MRHLTRLACCIIAIASTMGCSAIQKLDKDATFAVSAAALDKEKVKAVIASTNGEDAKAALGSLVFDSETKCGEFMSNLIVNETGSNTILDIGTTIATATATAISGPISLIHGFTAAGAITSGTKNAINSDFFAKASVANYAQAIQSTYYTQIGLYLNSLQAVDPPQEGHVKSWASFEIGKIQAYHAECGIGPAQSAVTATLALANDQKKVERTSTVLTITTEEATGAKDAGFVLVSLSSPSLFLPPAKANVTKGQKAADIAKAVATAVTGMITAANSTVTAAAMGDAQVKLTSDEAANVTWKVEVRNADDKKPSGVKVELGKAAAPAPAPVAAAGGTAGGGGGAAGSAAANAAAPSATSVQSAPQTPTAKVGAAIQDQ